MSQHAGGPPSGLGTFQVDLVEHGAPREGEPQSLDRRLFMQLHVFTGALDSTPAIQAVKESGLEAVVYANLNDPRGLGILLMSEDPEELLGARRLLLAPPFSSMEPLPDFTMIGRTYAAGREKELEDWLLHKPRRNARNPELPWAIWYPLRRIGAFNRLERGEQGKMMAEHALIGRSYGEGGHALDIR
ncbi:MAG: hypothetical protein PVF68_02150, partial [Acidobacteriota bacterium]